MSIINCKYTKTFPHTISKCYFSVFHSFHFAQYHINCAIKPLNLIKNYLGLIEIVYLCTQIVFSMKDSERFNWGCLCFFAIMLVVFLIGKSLDNNGNSKESESATQGNDYQRQYQQKQQEQQRQNYLLNQQRMIELQRQLLDVPTKPQPRSSYAETPEDAYNNGYENGYEQGQYDGKHGYSHGTNYDDSSEYYDYYEERYKEGYEEGYDEGYSSGQLDFEERQEESEEENEDDW